MSRPASLAEVGRIALAGDGEAFCLAMDEFLDTFYLDHPDTAAQAARVAEAPPMTGDAFRDAWIGAVGEHLANRWGFEVPDWTRRDGHARLDDPRFVPDSKAMRGMLVVGSPPAFRARMIFTVPEPLQRARFPRDVPRLDFPMPPPAAPRVVGRA